MADENTTPPKISEISIGGTTYEIVDLHMRRTFMKYYDRLHGPYADMHGVLHESGPYTLHGTYLKENSIYLVYLVSNNDDYYDVAIVFKANQRLHKVSLASKNISTSFGIQIASTTGDNANLGFYPGSHSAIFGFIRLNSFNANEPSDASLLGNRANTWTLLTGTIGGHPDPDLELK